MTSPYKLLISLAPDDLEQLDALVRARQLEQPHDVASRAAVIRDLIRDAYQTGHRNELPAESQTSR